MHIKYSRVKQLKMDVGSSKGNRLKKYLTVFKKVVSIDFLRLGGFYLIFFNSYEKLKGNSHMII